MRFRFWKYSALAVVLPGTVWALLMAVQPVRAQDAFDRADRNGDGRLTADELDRDFPFARVDVNGDGVVTYTEAVAAVRAGIINSDGSVQKAAPVAEPRPDPRRSSVPMASAAAHGVGRLVPDFEFMDLAGQLHRLADFSVNRATVIAMTSTSCPMSRKYLPSLVQLSQQYSEQGVQFILVNCVASDSIAGMKEAARLLHETSIYVVDEDERFLHHPGAVSTTDVFVLDAARTVVYHGAVNDQYGIGYARDEPQHHWLRDALEDVLADRRVAVAATSAPGCLLEPDQPVKETASVTWHGRVSRIMQQHCQTCHHEGAVGPFPLMTYQEVSAHAAMIREVVETKRMPPWLAEDVSEPHPGWANDRSLAAADRHDLLAWLNGGRPEGDPQDAALPLQWNAGWQMGRPDRIVQIPESKVVRAEGEMPYEYAFVKWTSEEDTWVQGYEVRPTDISVVHHVIVEVLEPGTRRRMGGDGAGAYWAAYVPGNAAIMYPDGYGRRIPAGSTIQFQLHYQPNGTATTDQTELGLYLSKSVPEREVRTIAVANPRISIPAGAAAHVETFSREVPRDMPILGLMAHMHVRGTAFQIELDRRDGTDPMMLLNIPRYDFNWQLRYAPAGPVVLPRGSRLQLTAVYDNSTANPANPNPQQSVKWGDQTSDEMMIGYVETWVPVGTPPEARTRGSFSPLNRMMETLDRDGSGELSEAELRSGNGQIAKLLGANRELLIQTLTEADTDESGGLSRQELLNVRERLLQLRGRR